MQYHHEVRRQLSVGSSKLMLPIPESEVPQNNKIKFNSDNKTVITMPFLAFFVVLHFNRQQPAGYVQVRVVWLTLFRGRSAKRLFVARL
jgi:hypothetical protein